jgi:hypothetical protein
MFLKSHGFIRDRLSYLPDVLEFIPAWPVAKQGGVSCCEHRSHDLASSETRMSAMVLT